MQVVEDEQQRTDRPQLPDHLRQTTKDPGAPQRVRQVRRTFPGDAGQLRQARFVRRQNRQLSVQRGRQRSATSDRALVEQTMQQRNERLQGAATQGDRALTRLSEVRRLSRDDFYIAADGVAAELVDEPRLPDTAFARDEHQSSTFVGRKETNELFERGIAPSHARAVEVAGRRWRLRFRRALRHRQQRRQRLDDVLGVADSPSRILGQQPADQIVECGRHSVDQRRRPWRIQKEVLVLQSLCAIGDEGPPTGQKLEQNAAERVQIATRVEWLTSDLLGRHVTRCSVSQAFDLGDLSGGVPYERVERGPEVHEDRRTVGAEEEIRWFEVTVYDALAVDEGHDLRDLLEDLKHLAKMTGVDRSPSSRRRWTSEPTRTALVEVVESERRRSSPVPCLPSADPPWGGYRRFATVFDRVIPERARHRCEIGTTDVLHRVPEDPVVATTLPHANDAGVAAAPDPRQHRDFLPQEITLRSAVVFRTLDRRQFAGLFMAGLGHDTGPTLSHDRQNEVGSDALRRHLASAGPSSAPVCQTIVRGAGTGQ
jgi:hypothetical protein